MFINLDSRQTTFYFLWVNILHSTNIALLYIGLSLVLGMYGPGCINRFVTFTHLDTYILQEQKASLGIVDPLCHELCKPTLKLQDNYLKVYLTHMVCFVWGKVFFLASGESEEQSSYVFLQCVSRLWYPGGKFSSKLKGDKYIVLTIVLSLSRTRNGREEGENESSHPQSITVWKSHTFSLTHSLWEIFADYFNIVTQEVWSSLVSRG